MKNKVRILSAVLLIFIVSFAFSGQASDCYGDEVVMEATMGVGYQGDFTVQEMTDEQVMSGAWLNAKLIIDEGLTLEDIWGHKDVSYTACPGNNFRTEDLLRETEDILRGVYSD